MLSQDHLCSSCAACANICPRNAIKMVLNENGFFRPEIDSLKCIHCGLCEKKCPWEKSIENPGKTYCIPYTFAAYAKDLTIRSKSSSGGVFSVLAQEVLDNNGIVVGVAQLSKTKFGHITVSKIEDLEKLRGSKYVQADVGLIYKETKKKLNEGRLVLFSGTPCQVAGLYATLGERDYDNLYTVDVVCHGAPSVKVFEKYINEIEKKESAIAINTSFRDKISGWRKFSLTNTFVKDGHTYSKSNDLLQDLYMRIFLNNLCLNDSCADCHYAKIPRIADVTLGDYWGIEQYHPEMGDDQGSSAVLINTEKGLKLFNKIKSNLEYVESTLANVMAGNKNISRSSVFNKNRDSFFQNLNNTSLSTLKERYYSTTSFTQRICRKLKKIIKQIQKLVLNVFFVHKGK